ncbi:hypothetical protein OG896_01310 [Streptomyces sp. NBC_00669]|uniref:hypothetical protein n=1 Tax=Streptomyces sp. NBC_00669 TaxID=2976011 RepID=UPI002E367B41|nr:hypothetical protein [Streptomyces sp. NBC_00669]
MPSFEPYAEALLGFLLSRIDEDGFASLLDHEPKRMPAWYVERGGGRFESRMVMFTGCVTCSRIEPGSEFSSYVEIDVEQWPCLRVRRLALAFHDDPDYREEWRPELAMHVSGRRFCQEDGDQWPPVWPPSV